MPSPHTSSPQLPSYVTRLRRITCVLIAAVIIFTPPTLAFAHEGGEDDEAHAQQDLAGTSVSEIERRTNAVKEQLRRTKRAEPGAARAYDTSEDDQTYVAVAAKPEVSGVWSSVFNTPVVPVFQAVLPSGKILMWDSVGDKAAEDYTAHTYTRAAVWNPITNSSKRVDVKGYNIFCAGFAHLANGNIVVAGGNKNNGLDGIVQTHVFDWRKETWTRGRDMEAQRWYPALAAMANGEVVIVGGTRGNASENPEVYQTNGVIRELRGIPNGQYASRLYPLMTSRFDTQLQLLGPYNNLYSYSIAGAGTQISQSVRDGKDRNYGSFVTYDVNKHLVVGGGLNDNNTKGPTATAVIVNTFTNGAPAVTTTDSMSQPRRQQSATVLADGTVVVTGGMKSAAKSSTVDLSKAVTSAELWNPATGTWRVLASANRIREYHSTAVLLPDGRVMTGGGGICGDCVKAGYLEKNTEYFSPPYLFKKDGSGQPATRPRIATAPSTIGINQQFSFTSPQANTIKKVALVGLSDSTHSTDQGQRYIPLKYNVSGTTITALSPATGGIAPPGYYMLFIVNADGVPSVAETVLVSKSPNPLLSPIKNRNSGKCIDVPRASLANQTYSQSYTCNGSGAQAMTRMVNDNTIRVISKCLAVPNNSFKSGQKIWTTNCAATPGQKWVFHTDGTIRPATQPTFCLTATGRANKSTITIATCNSNSTLQKWTW